MANKGHRAGGKFVSSHTTLIEAAEAIVDAANQDPDVTKIRLGIIIQSQGSTDLRVKFRDEDSGIVLFIHKRCTQEVRLYTSNVQGVRTRLCRFALNNGYAISFMKLKQQRRSTPRYAHA